MPDSLSKQLFIQKKARKTKARRSREDDQILYGLDVFKPEVRDLAQAITQDVTMETKSTEVSSPKELKREVVDKTLKFSYE